MTTAQVATTRRQIHISKKDSDLFTAAETYKRREMPVNLDADAHLQAGNKMRASWILGTRIVYAAPDVKFTRLVRSDNLEYEVPTKYQGLKNTALVMQGPDFEIDRTSGAFKGGTVTNVIENYPATDGWYNTDATTGIPQGVQVSNETDTARYLWRRENAPYIGVLVRLWVVGWCGGRYVLASSGPDVGFGVAKFGEAEPELKQLLAQAPEQLGDLLRMNRDADAALAELGKHIRPESLATLQKLVNAVKELN